MKTLTRIAVTTITTGALALATVGAADATPTPTIYNPVSNISQRTATAHLMGASKNDPAIRAVKVTRTATTITTTISVNRIDRKAVSGGWTRIASGAMELWVNGSAKIQSVTETYDGKRGWSCSNSNTHGTITSGSINYAKNIYTLTLPLSTLRKCGIRKGQTVTVDGAALLEVVNIPQRKQGMWFALRKGISFKY